jgi:predicted DNA-binding protein with PD1-like motif
VGSLKKAVLRLADLENLTHLVGPFEITSLVGTVSIYGSHLHLSISDGDGMMKGGHLAKGCEIYTTAEMVVGEIPGQRYTRELCLQSGYPELVIHPES